MAGRNYRINRRKEEPKETDKICDHEGCEEPAYFKAPKDRRLKEYYWFCEKHIKEYNENWNFYKGLSDEEIEKEISSSYVWDRPTYKFSSYSSFKDFRKAANFFEFFKDLDNNMFDHNKKDILSVPPDVSEALKIMELTIPITDISLKSKYKELAKMYHPDLNSGNKESEEIFKKISLAYQTLLEFIK